MHICDLWNEKEQQYVIADVVPDDLAFVSHIDCTLVSDSFFICFSFSLLQLINKLDYRDRSLDTEDLFGHR